MRVAAEVAQIREQATQELNRLTTLESGVRTELVRLSSRLAAEVARTATPARGAPEGADGGAPENGTAPGNGTNGNAAAKAGADGGPGGSVAGRDEPARAGEAHR